jgi:hypothetical protein
MAKRNNLAALAALAGLGYVLTNQSRNKVDLTEKDSNPDRKARPDSTETREAPFKATNESAYTGTTKNDSNTAKNIGFGGGDNSDKNLKRVAPAEPIPVKPPKLDVVTNSALPPAEPKPSDKPLYKQNVTIAGDKKRTEGNQPMPSLRAVEAKVASNKTDALRNASRKTAASNTPKSKTPPASTSTALKTPDAPKSETTNGKFEMPITKFFKGIRERGDEDLATRGLKRGGTVKMASGGMAASRRGDGIAQRGKTRGKMC